VLKFTWQDVVSKQEPAKVQQLQTRCMSRNQTVAAELQNLASGSGYAEACVVEDVDDGKEVQVGILGRV
jgi:hypothetical protein